MADDTDALLKELESRANSGSSAKIDEDEEDLEAFLASLDAGDDSPAPAAKVATKPKMPEPAPPKEAPKAELTKPDPPKKEAKTEKAEPTDHAQKKSKLPVVLALMKWGFVSLTTTSAIWLLGAYLAQWISAWWLVLAIALVVTLSLPLGFWQLSKRKGKKAWWFAGVSTLVLAGLIAPMPTMAANVIGSYGHWPSTAINAARGAEATSGAHGALTWFSAFLAGQLGAEASTALELGTQHPVAQEPSTEEAPSETPPEAKTPEEAPAEPVVEPKTTEP